MIEGTIVDLLVWVVAIAMLMIGAVRIITFFVTKVDHNKRKDRVIYCNVCVSYFNDSSEQDYVKCPTCERNCRRGRPRKLG